jgi:hypothetical protein
MKKCIESLPKCFYIRLFIYYFLLFGQQTLLEEIVVEGISQGKVYKKSQQEEDNHQHSV